MASDRREKIVGACVFFFGVFGTIAGVFVGGPTAPVTGMLGAAVGSAVGGLVGLVIASVADLVSPAGSSRNEAQTVQPSANNALLGAGYQQTDSNPALLVSANRQAEAEGHQLENSSTNSSFGSSPTSNM